VLISAQDLFLTILLIIHITEILRKHNIGIEVGLGTKSLNTTHIYTQEMGNKKCSYKHITSDVSTLGGEPTLVGFRIPVSQVICFTSGDGIDGYIEDFGLDINPKIRDAIKEAMEYCMKQDCEIYATVRCHDCNKGNNGTTPMWDTARKMYEHYFGRKKQ